MQRDKCFIWVHIKCNKINLQTRKSLQKSPSVWYCIKSPSAWYCILYEDIVPFGPVSNEKLFKINQWSKIKFTIRTKNHTSLSQGLIDQLNAAMDEPSLKQFPASTMSPASFYLCLITQWNVDRFSISTSPNFLEELTTFSVQLALYHHQQLS